MSARRAVFLAVFIAVAPGARDARAQQPPPGALRLAASEPPVTVKYHASFLLSGGFDLDVIGNIVEGALGERDGDQVALRQSLPWPDVYVSVPKRADLALGFGVFQKDEVVLRLSRATYTSDPVTDAGNFVGRTGDGTLTLKVSQYRERAWEVGWRHYLVLTRRFKQYANIMYGRRTVEPISADFVVSGPTGSVGTFRLYDRATIPTFSLEIGLSWEKGHLGVFGQIGGRWQQKLKRNDDDLVVWGLQPVNNTTARFYMPMQCGVVFRL